MSTKSELFGQVLHMFVKRQLLVRDDDSDGATPECQVQSDYDDKNWGARISSIFVIMVTSMFGAFFPILSSRYSFIRLPNWCFFIAKFFGSGVIIATSFIHLLQPANENLSDDCLGGVFASYPLAFGIALIMLFVMFFIELIAYKYVEDFIVPKAQQAINAGHAHTHGMGNGDYATKDFEENDSGKSADEKHIVNEDPDSSIQENDSAANYLGNLLAVFILEFGIIFHSVFVGLTLGCAGKEFVTLYIVLVFHQMFEGLGLGTRIAMVDWPKSKRLTPWLLALAYGLTTPISIAIGVGVRNSYLPGSRTALITNGVFDSISAGILIYTGLVELMAHEFLFSEEFKGKEAMGKMVVAYIVMMVGAGVMALLGKWA
ncbi:unnamed protein product [Ambrosiozyma monospora]|uniref:Unnamed protein product n=1 Tax=Ambrosiozyma monospora TaxID=43982 RepID=A0A9W6YTA6_AMBMO|nr:unnamed protein product [Ambrosiozyma monospora]